MTTFFKWDMEGRTHAKAAKAKDWEKQWQRTRACVLVRDRRCRVCRKAASYDVHHIERRKRDHSNDTVTNCIGLCRGCHEDRHLGCVVIRGTATALQIERVR